MIHFYYGENSLGIRRQVDLVTSKFAEKYGAENVARLDAGDVDKVLGELVNVGLFANNRLIILSGVFDNKTLMEKLPDAMPRVADETDVVIIEPKPDKRTKLFKNLKDNYKVKEFALPEKKNLQKFLQQFVADEAAAQKVEIKPDVTEFFISYCGGDMWRIAGEIAKFKSLDKAMTKANIEKFVEPDLEVSVFQLLDDLFAGRRDKVLGQLQSLRKTEDPNKFLGLLASQVFALAAASHSDKPPNQTSADIGVHPFVVSKMFPVARRITPAEVAKIAKIIAETDAKAKLSSQDDAWTLIELAMNKI